jgi:succinate dehydrogenase / fumarate reductase cytochrome b subunit
VNRGQRPVFLNFARIRFPVGAVASIGHRISGVLLALCLPFAVLALERSLSLEAGSRVLPEGLQSLGGRAGLALVAWAAAHHLFAGIRHLLMDIGVGSELRAGRASAHAALASAAAIAVGVLVL